MTRLTGATYTKIVLVVLLCLVLCGGLLSCVNGCNRTMRHAGEQFAANFEAADFENIGNAEIESAEIRNIEVQWAAGQVDVVVLHDESEQIRLTETAPASLSQRQQMRWQVIGNSLQIGYGWENTWMMGCSANGKKQLTIEIPAKLAEHLGAFTLQAASGTYNFDAIGCESFNVDLASGNVNGTGLQANNLSLNVASGGVYLDGEFSDRLDFDIASGNVNVACNHTCPARVDINLMSGNANVGLPPDSNFTADVDKLSGSFDCAFPSGSHHDDHCTVGTGDSRFDINITSGNVTLYQA